LQSREEADQLRADSPRYEEHAIPGQALVGGRDRVALRLQAPGRRAKARNEQVKQECFRRKAEAAHDDEVRWIAFGHGEGCHIGDHDDAEKERSKRNATPPSQLRRDGDHQDDGSIERDDGR
jgi:thiamine monophosphate synthase